MPYIMDTNTDTDNTAALLYSNAYQKLKQAAFFIELAITPEVADKQLSSGAFTIPDEWVSGATYGGEGLHRLNELAQFIDSSQINPASKQDWEAFIADQIKRWVDGNEVVPVSDKHMVGGCSLI